jgi:hypothetical protein
MCAGRTRLITCQTRSPRLLGDNTNGVLDWFNERIKITRDGEELESPLRNLTIRRSIQLLQYPVGTALLTPLRTAELPKTT